MEVQHPGVEHEKRKASGPDHGFLESKASPQPGPASQKPLAKGGSPSRLPLLAATLPDLQMNHCPNEDVPPPLKAYAVYCRLLTVQVSLLWQGVDPAVMGELYCFLLPQPGWNFLELPFWFVVHSFLSLFLKSVYKFFCFFY